MNLNDMRISVRLMLGFGIMSLLIVLLGGISLVKTAVADGAFKAVIDDRVPKMVMLNDVKSDIYEIGLSLRNMVIMTDPVAVKKQVDNVLAKRAAIGESLKTLQADIKTEKGKTLLGKVFDGSSRYVEGQIKYIELVEAGKQDEAKPYLIGTVRPSQLAYFAAVDQLAKFQQELLQESGAQANAAVSSITMSVWSVGIVAILFAFALSQWVIRSITRPINQAVDVARAVANGDLSQQFDSGGKNETARLMSALKDMQTSLV